jgi:hypothetical protein
MEAAAVMKKWSSAKNTDIDALRAFLLPRESACVSFTSRLYDPHTGSMRIPPRRQARILHCSDNDGRMRGALYTTAGGFLYPVFGTELRKELQQSPSYQDGPDFSGPKPYSIMGVKQDVRIIEGLIGRPPDESVEYYLWAEHGTAPQGPVQTPPEISIRTARPCDSEAVFPIQAAYEKEEVLLQADRFDAASTLYHLRKNLKKHRILIGIIDGRVVAKAGTNARGFRYDQIGGVFTHPALRNRGIARQMMIELLAVLHGEGKKTCLFVKKSNPPALRLYRNLGYTISDDFLISYYHVRRN